MYDYRIKNWKRSFTDYVLGIWELSYRGKKMWIVCWNGFTVSYRIYETLPKAEVPHNGSSVWLLLTPPTYDLALKRAKEYISIMCRK